MLLPGALRGENGTWMKLVANLRMKNQRRKHTNWPKPQTKTHRLKLNRFLIKREHPLTPRTHGRAHIVLAVAEIEDAQVLPIL